MIVLHLFFCFYDYFRNRDFYKKNIINNNRQIRTGTENIYTIISTNYDNFDLFYQLSMDVCYSSYLIFNKV